MEEDRAARYLRLGLPYGDEIEGHQQAKMINALDPKAKASRLEPNAAVVLQVVAEPTLVTGLGLASARDISQCPASAIRMTSDAASSSHDVAIVAEPTLVTSLGLASATDQIATAADSIYFSRSQSQEEQIAALGSPVQGTKRKLDFKAGLKEFFPKTFDALYMQGAQIVTESIVDAQTGAGEQPLLEHPTAAMIPISKLGVLRHEESSSQKKMPRQAMGEDRAARRLRLGLPYGDEIEGHQQAEMNKTLDSKAEALLLHHLLAPRSPSID